MEGLHSEEKFGPDDLEKLQMRGVTLINVNYYKLTQSCPGP